MLRLFSLGIIALSMVLILPSLVNAEPSAKIIQHRGYIDASGIYHVVGEVQNNGDQPVGFITISVEFYDEYGDVITTDKILARIHTVLPGELAPFDATALGRDMAKDVYSYELTAVAQVAKPKPLALLLQSNMSYLDELGLYHVVGKVENNGDKDSTYTTVISTFYDDEGGIIATGRDLSEPINIGSGETGEFKITVHRDLADKIASYSIDAESNEFLLMKTLT